MDFKFIQQLLIELDLNEQIYHLFNSLLIYGAET